MAPWSYGLSLLLSGPAVTVGQDKWASLAGIRHQVSLRRVVAAFGLCGLRSVIDGRTTAVPRR
jgi:hypothetical protein